MQTRVQAESPGTAAQNELAAHSVGSHHETAHTGATRNGTTHLLWRSDEGCGAIARPWSRPLVDFAVDEFLALSRLFGGPPNPLGTPEAVAVARERLRSGEGPVVVAAHLEPKCAAAIASRLVSGTLHEVLLSCPTLSDLRNGVLRLDAQDRAGGASEPWWCGGERRCGAEPAPEASAATAPPSQHPQPPPPPPPPPPQPQPQPPHTLLIPFGARLPPISAKRRKATVRTFLAGTSLDLTSGPKGCGSRHTWHPGDGGAATAKAHFAILVAGSALDSASATEEGEGRGVQRAQGALREVGSLWHLTRLVGVGSALARVASVPPPPELPGKTTPIRAELAWVVANLARVGSGQVVVDPFAGTGSLLAPCIALGGTHVIGLDIHTAGVSSVGGHGVDSVCANIHALPLRCGDSEAATRQPTGLYDAVVCDPPYGLRKPRMASAGAKDSAVPDGLAMQSAVAAALAPVLEFAARSLVGGGRLVYFFPSFDFGLDEGRDDCGRDVALAAPRHPQLEWVACCTQVFKGMARHVVVMERARGERETSLLQ